MNHFEVHWFSKPLTILQHDAFLKPLAIIRHVIVQAIDHFEGCFSNHFSVPFVTFFAVFSQVQDLPTQVDQMAQLRNVVFEVNKVCVSGWVSFADPLISPVSLTYAPTHHVLCSAL